jgi:hypothetical protein
MCTGTLVLDVDDLNQVGYVYFPCMSVLGCFCDWYVRLYFCYANNRNGGSLVKKKIMLLYDSVFNYLYIVQ